MSYLLDSHVWLWALIDPSRLGPRTRAVLNSAKSRVHLSAVTTWELTIKWRLGKLTLPGRPADVVRDSLVTHQLEALCVTHEHAWKVGDLPDHHQDPFDRLLIAQALTENLELITADPTLRAYPVAIQWALD